MTEQGPSRHNRQPCTELRMEFDIRVLDLFCHARDNVLSIFSGGKIVCAAWVGVFPDPAIVLVDMSRMVIIFVMFLKAFLELCLIVKSDRLELMNALVVSLM